MTRWLLTVTVPQGPTPLGSLGGDLPVAAFAYHQEQEQEAREAAATIQESVPGARCLVSSFYVAPRHLTIASDRTTGFSQ
jgi:hypothetical protein